ncbi:helix-turn-helix domain-containing protein [Specibacter sp. NPDC057265]|uniref:helix-turn-helix domain-containing protein n=1 Tax=Specibacter sp. NPDC057265 TaxID=3346075 RepID=UPI0036401EBA
MRAGWGKNKGSGDDGVRVVAELDCVFSPLLECGALTRWELPMRRWIGARRAAEEICGPGGPVMQTTASPAGDRIRRLRLASSLGQVELADRIGIASGTMSMIETGALPLPSAHI